MSKFFPPKEWGYNKIITGGPNSRFDFSYISQFNFELWMEKVRNNNFINICIEEYLDMLMEKHVEYYKDGVVDLKGLDDLIKNINGGISNYEDNHKNKEWFVRLSYRSAKDVPEGRMSIMDGDEAVMAIIKSKRCFDDMIAHKYHTLRGVKLPLLGINLVPWTNCKVERELRCFVFNGRLVAVTFQIPNLPWPFFGLEKCVIERLKEFVNQLWNKHNLYNCAVVDVELNNLLECKLIEFNPYGKEGSTGAILFDWVDDTDILFNDDSKDVTLRYTYFGRVREVKFDI
jgi:hypothetical protein